MRSGELPSIITSFPRGFARNLTRAMHESKNRELDSIRAFLRGYDNRGPCNFIGRQTQIFVLLGAQLSGYLEKVPVSFMQQSNSNSVTMMLYSEHSVLL